MVITSCYLSEIYDLSFYPCLSFGNIDSMNPTNYTLEQAITVMKNSTKLAQPFKIKFRKLSGGNTIITRAALRPMAGTAADKMGKYKLQLVNQENDQLRSCYIPLIMEVNGIKVKI